MDSVGGFVGGISRNTDMIMTVSNCTNNGNVSAVEGCVGGLFGWVDTSTNMNITISSTINNGNVTGNDYVGGLVGHIYSYSQSELMTLNIINSANKGIVSAKQGRACGFVCIDSMYHFNMHIMVKNSINKGSVNATTNGYGITNNITVARNVVSMGDVTGPSGSYTFWDVSTDVDLFYGLDGKCINCSDDATLFQHNTDTGFYEVVETGEHVNDLLNDESVNQHFGMVWTKELELALTMNVSGLWNGTLLAELGAQLNEVGNLSDYFNDEEWCVGDEDSQPRIAFKPTQLVTRNMNVVVGKCMNVTVGAPINKSETMIAGETLDHLAFFFRFSLDDFIVVAKGSQQVLNQSSVIETDTVLKLCHNVNVSGFFNYSFIAESGTRLDEVGNMSDYFNDEELCVGDGDRQPRISFKPTHLVMRNMNVIVGKCMNATVLVKSEMLR